MNEDRTMQLSDQLVHAVRCSERRAYLIAHEIGASPSQFSAWLNRIQGVRADDPRVQRLAALMGLELAAALQPWARGFAGVGGVEFRGRRAS
jgi:hypothetical protein